jgi:putative endonuclease
LPYYVYLLASRKDGTLYLGVTRDLVRRTYEHKTNATPGFASRYDVRRLVWFEIYDDPTIAITREKEIKKWRREWKIELIEKSNADWARPLRRDHTINARYVSGFRVRAFGAPRNDGERYCPWRAPE